MLSRWFLVKKKQSGLALIVLIVFLALSVSTYYLSTISIGDIKVENSYKTRAALKKAKQALIGYALARSDSLLPSPQLAKYGYLPCPSNNNLVEGRTDGNCNDKRENTIGWFPWRSLGMAPLKDGNGDCLLYAVSGSYKFSPEADMLNEDTYGMLQLVDESGAVMEGVDADSRVVAIVFSAGATFNGQNRVHNVNSECGDDDNNFSAYLDTLEVPPGGGVFVDNSTTDIVNEDRVDRFIKAVTAANTDVFNDQLLSITKDEIWRPVMQRIEFDETVVTGESRVRHMTEALARCIASYVNDNDNRRLPFPAPADLNGGDYRENAAYTDAIIPGASHIGRFPYSTAQADALIPGTVANDELFEKNFTVGAGIWDCDALQIQSPPGPDADLRTAAAEARRLWDNWKDHIIYAVSDEYEPSAAAYTPPPRCGNCISFNGTEYAAIVIYSGSKLDVLVQTRAAPVAGIDAGVVIDSKQAINNYIEVVNPAGDGQGDYTPAANSNDIYFCLTDEEPVNVVPCI